MPKQHIILSFPHLYLKYLPEPIDTIDTIDRDTVDTDTVDTIDIVDIVDTDRILQYCVVLKKDR